MADLPIPFSRPMSLALREGRKTQTRRYLNPQPRVDDQGNLIVGKWNYGQTIGDRGSMVANFNSSSFRKRLRIPSPGDRLWVREEHYRFGHWVPIEGELTRGGRQKWAFVADSDEVLYDPPARFRRSRHLSDFATPFWHKRNARFMFRRHSRITLLVTDVRVQHLQDIDEADAAAEGTQEPTLRDLGGDLAQAAWSERQVYSRLWNHLHGAGAWDLNPWVSATTFTVTLKNIDQVSR